MKTVTKRRGFLAKFSLIAGLLATGQQALAQGTTAGTTIDNTASISFSVNGVVQPVVASDTASFVVDRRVDFVVSAEDVTLETIAPTQTGLFLSFLVTNESNDTLDFDLVFRVLADTETFPGGTATGETMDNISIEVAQNAVGTSGGDATETPVRGANRSSIDDLPAEAVIRVHIYSDAPGTLTNGAIPAIELSATALDSAGAALSDDTAAADDPTALQNVFVNGTVTLVDADGFQVAAASLSATKDSEVIEDPFNGTTNPKAIPGAFIEYTFVVTNSDTGLASSVVISDTLDTTLVQLRDGAYDGGASNVDLGGGSYCNADTVATDGCTYDPGTGVLSIELGDLAGSGAQTVKFQVTVQ